MKECAVCKLTLPREMFARRAASKDGLQHRCRGCFAAWYMNGGKVKTRAAERRRYWSDVEAARERNRRKDRSPVRVASRLTRRRERYATDPRFRLACIVKSSARRGGSKTTHEITKWSEIVAADPCSYCGGVTEHIDHIAPLGRGGEHDVSNLTASCGSCNVRKSDRTLLGFLLARKP